MICCLICQLFLRLWYNFKLMISINTKFRAYIYNLSLVMYLNISAQNTFELNEQLSWAILLKKLYFVKGVILYS